MDEVDWSIRNQGEGWRVIALHGKGPDGGSLMIRAVQGGNESAGYWTNLGWWRAGGWIGWLEFEGWLTPEDIADQWLIWEEGEG